LGSGTVLGAIALALFERVADAIATPIPAGRELRTAVSRAQPGVRLLGVVTLTITTGNLVFAGWRVIGLWPIGSRVLGRGDPVTKRRVPLLSTLCRAVGGRVLWREQF
jgi:hypothetical protein